MSHLVNRSICSCLLTMLLLLLPIDCGHAMAQSATESPSWLDSESKAFFSSPDFKRRFLESFVAETDVEPKLTEDERETLQSFQELLAEDKPVEAESLLLEKRNEASGAVLDFYLGNLYTQNERFDEAIAAYEMAVEKYPRFRRAWRLLGVISTREGFFDKGVAAFTRVIELGGADVQCYGLLGVGYTKLERPLAAESAFRMAILMQPENVNWQIGLCQSFFMQQRYADVAALATTLINQDPQNAQYWEIQANAYIGLGEAMKAAENFEVLDGMGKSTAASLNMLADIYANESLFDLAVENYVKAMTLDPDAPAKRPIRAAKMLVARSANKQSEILLDAIDRMKGDALDSDIRRDLLMIRARMSIAQDKGDESAEILERIIEIDPLDGDALILLGNHYKSKGDGESAIFYYQRASGIDAFEADAKLAHAQLLVNDSQYKAAVPLLRRVQELTRRSDVQEFLETVEWFSKNR